MKDCQYCTEFDNSGIFETLQDEFDNINFRKINGPENMEFCQKYGISSYPKLIIVENNKHKIFPSDNRNLMDLRKFLM